MEAVWSIVTYIFIFLYGLLVGSFLNVVIFRVPKKESVAKKRSHCMTCGYTLAWFDLIPLFSWLALRGKCRKCGAKISAQYPIIEGLNALLCVLIFMSAYGLNSYLMFEEFKPETLLYCFMTSALIALSVIDLRTFIIPPGFNIFIAVLGVINIIYRLVFLGLDEAGLAGFIIGAFAVSVPLGIIYYLSDGRAIGGGDIKLMAAAGLLIGWKLILFALFIGCLVGSVIHIARMKLTGAEHKLAMGPYLSVGIYTAVTVGNRFLDWYLGLFARK